MGLGIIAFFLVLTGLIAGFLKNLGCNAPINRVQLLISIYFGILLVSLAVFFMIPNRNFVDLPGSVDPNALQKAEQASLELYSAASQGRLNQLDGVYVKEKWRFDFNGDTLEVVKLDGEYVNTMIVAKKKEISDGKIQITSYMTRIILEGLDFTEKINAPRVEMEGNKLKISDPVRFEIDLYRYDDASITQFRGKRKARNSQGFQNVIGQQLLYLEVPRHVNLDASTLNANVLIVD